ncbi:putative abc-type fe3+ transport periplasmic component protein [Venturia nashicola]|nr:putative abc-type fe3+ transport periplasmic component protein [Venturia nashicola]
MFPNSLVYACLFARAVNCYTANVPVETRSLDEIYEAAQGEDGNLVVVWGGDAGPQGNSLRTAWKARFPKITLDLSVDLSKYHDSRIDRAWLIKNETVDIATLQTLHDFKRWKQQDRLIFGNFVYDSTKLNASQIPTSYADLLDPFWKSKLVLTYPNDDDAINYLFTLIVSKYGFGWLDALSKQDVQWVRGTATPAYVIVDNNRNTTSSSTIACSAGPSKGRILSFTTGSISSGNTSFLVSQAPLAPEQKMAWAQTTAAFASTKRPETAKLFLSWITSKEWQTGAGFSPLKSFDQGKVMLSNNTQTSGFRQFMADRTEVEWWKLQFETTIGSAQGPSPMEMYP